MLKIKSLSVLLLFLMPITSSYAQIVSVPKKSSISAKSFKQSYKPQLLAAIADMNETLPVESELGITATQYFLEGNNLVLKTICDESLINVDTFNNRKELMHSVLIEHYRNSKDISSLFALLVKNDAGFEIRYVGGTTGKRCSILLTPQEVKEISTVTNSERDPRAAVAQFIKLENENYPAVIADGLRVNRCYMEDFYVVYEASVDEGIYSISEMNSNKEDIKREIIAGFNVNDFAVRSQLEAFIHGRFGVEYRYVGDVTKRVCAVKISVAELRSLVE